VIETLITYDSLYLNNTNNDKITLIEPNPSTLSHSTSNNGAVNNWNYENNKGSDSKKILIKNNNNYNIYNNNIYMSMKSSPNDFETFNFDNKKSFLRSSYISGDNHNNLLKKNNTDTKIFESNHQESNTNFNNLNSNMSKQFDFSLLNSKPNNVSNNKSFVDIPHKVENPFKNIIENKNEDAFSNEKINIDYLQNLMMHRETFHNSDNNYAYNFVNTYDSNYGIG